MNVELLKKLLICMAIQLSTSVLLHAGYITMTTSDSAPTYNESNTPPHSEVVIGTSTGNGASTTTVTLTTTCTNGTVSVSYTPSSGVTKSSDTGSGTTSETAVFGFNSATVGVVNTIKATVTQSGAYEAPLNNTITCVPNFNYPGASGTTITFTICVPKITVPIYNAGYNDFYEGYFLTQPTISGCDDF